MATTEQYSLRWNNFHSNLTQSFHELFLANEMVDVTLAVGGQCLQAHKIILSMCSPYFKEMFKANPCKHPIVIVNDVSFQNMKDILVFMYMGEVNVSRDNLSNFLRIAENLQVKGLTGDDSQSDTSSRKGDKSDSIADNDEEGDMMQFNQMIDSDVELPTHYSTPRLPTPPPVTQSVPSTPNSKRQSKHLSLNCKRAKTTEFNSNLNQSSKAPIKSDVDWSATKMEASDNLTSCKPNTATSTVGTTEDSDYVDSSQVKPDKPQMDLSDEVRENLKYLLDSSLGPVTSSESVTDNDLLYSPDQKHVFCPYCCRKFVNRYNLKVHIRDKHEDSDIDLGCRICGKVMRNRSCLRVHMYHHRKQQLEAATALQS